VLFGFGLGVPLTMLFGNAISASVAETINLLIPMVLTPRHVGLALAIVVLVSEVTTRLSARRLSRISMSDALKAGAE
jgi:putative ABC transport system permease protein